ncbi:MAG: hypothetical protein WCO44_12370 [Bacteroidota bacterium]
MRTVKSYDNQSLFDIAIQEIGAIESVWDILDANTGLQLDLSLPASANVVIPDIVLKKQVVAYFADNNLHPVSGLDEESIVTQNDMNTIKQDLDYNLHGGDKEFAGVRLFFLHDMLSVQIVYTGITADTVVVSVDQSLDGVNWTTIPYVNQIIDKTKEAHTFNIIGLLTDFVRLHLSVPDASDGTITSVTWKT